MNSAASALLPSSALIHVRMPAGKLKINTGYHKLSVDTKKPISLKHIEKIIKILSANR